MPGMKFFRGWISGKAFQIDARSAIDFEDIGNSQLVLVQDLSIPKSPIEQLGARACRVILPKLVTSNQSDRIVPGSAGVPQCLDEGVIFTGG